MGKTRVVSAVTNSMEDILAHERRRDTHFGSDRTRAATDDKERDGESGTIAEFEQAPDSSRSRGYGRYEI